MSQCKDRRTLNLSCGNRGSSGTLTARLRRALIACGLAGLLSLVTAVSAAAAFDRVQYAGDYAAGTIVIQTGERRLYLILEDGTALRYIVGVGRPGWQWTGATSVEAKYVEPSWSPPPEIRREQPELPDLIPGGSPANPLGAAAMTLAGGAYAIHGTNAPESIGGFVSYGCIRMHNDDIVDLYARVGVGTLVVVLP